MVSRFKQVLNWWGTFLRTGMKSIVSPGELSYIITLGNLLSETRWFEYSLRKFKEQDRHNLMATIPKTEAILPEALKQLPVGSLGRDYVDFIERNNLDTYTHPAGVEDEKEWLRERSRFLHDYIHIVLGRSTSVKDEIILNSYLAYSLNLPISTLILYGGLIHLFIADFGEFKATSHELKQVKIWCEQNPSILTFPLDTWVERPVKFIRSKLNLSVPLALAR